MDTQIRRMNSNNPLFIHLEWSLMRLGHSVTLWQSTRMEYILYSLLNKSVFITTFPTVLEWKDFFSMALIIDWILSSYYGLYVSDSLLGLNVFVDRQFLWLRAPYAESICSVICLLCILSPCKCINCKYAVIDCAEVNPCARNEWRF